MGAHGSKVGQGAIECPYSEKPISMDQRSVRVKSDRISNSFSSYHSQTDGASTRCSGKESAKGQSTKKVRKANKKPEKKKVGTFFSVE